MKQKLLNLLEKKKGIVGRMQAADAADDQAAFDTAKTELEAVDKEISRVQDIMQAMESTPAPSQAELKNTQAVSSRECIHAFCECVRAQARGNRQRFEENAAIVRRAVQNDNNMTEAVPADGGLIVPQDIQTKINELRRTLNPLANLFHVENVTFVSGSRVIDTAPTAGFTKLNEFDTISRDDKPAFRKIEYKIDDYGLIVPVSNDLLQDTDQNLLEYLSRWFAKKLVITENNLLLTLLAALDAAATIAAAGKELATIKKALNVTLDPAIALTSVFLTNQSGFNYLDTLEDEMGRPLLQPNPANGTVKMLLARPVHVVSNSVLPDNGGAPLYIGDLTQYGTLFRRKALEVRSTDIGGRAWDTNSTEVRGIARMGALTFDEAAAVAIKLPVS